MADVIDFQIERAVRKSGIRDKALIRDIIDEGYDPCNSVDMINYYNWKEFESQVFTQVEHNWTDEAIEQLMGLIVTVSPT